jgi:hypothetical protein
MSCVFFFPRLAMVSTRWVRAQCRYWWILITRWVMSGTDVKELVQLSEYQRCMSKLRSLRWVRLDRCEPSVLISATYPVSSELGRCKAVSSRKGKVLSRYETLLRDASVNSDSGDSALESADVMMWVFWREKRQEAWANQRSVLSLPLSVVWPLLLGCTWVCTLSRSGLNGGSGSNKVEIAYYVIEKAYYVSK